ncbi:MAG: MFS transporter [Opitutaceae bacterium]|nr:MFS transporter [Opitutaceae bacterium]
MISEPPRPAGAWRVVGLLWVVGCLNYLDRVMITTMRGSLKEAIPMTEAQFGLLTTAFLIVYALLSPFAGYLADRFTRSSVISASLIAWSLFTWMTAHVTTYEQLLATRLLMGVSEACFLPAALALVADYHRGASRSLATGIVLGGVMVGSALGGVGGWIAERWHWSHAFTLFGVVGVGFAFVLMAWLRDPPRLEAGLPASVGSPSRVGVAEVARSLLGNGNFLLAFVFWGLLGVAAWMVIGWMPTYLQEHFGLSQSRAGLIATSYVNIASLIGLVVGGAWADRWSRTNRRACLHVTALGLFASVPSILLVAGTGSLPLAIVGLVAYGLTIAFASTEMMPILCLILAPRHLATGFGVLNFFACAVGGATTYAGGALRDAQIDVSRLFQAGALGMAACAGLLFLIRPRSTAA